MERKGQKFKSSLVCAALCFVRIYDLSGKGKRRGQGLRIQQSGCLDSTTKLKEGHRLGKLQLRN